MLLSWIVEEVFFYQPSNPCLGTRKHRH